MSSNGSYVGVYSVGRRLQVTCASTTSVSTFSGLKDGIAALGSGVTGCYDIEANTITCTETITIPSGAVFAASVRQMKQVDTISLVLSH